MRLNQAFRVITKLENKMSSRKKFSSTLRGSLASLGSSVHRIPQARILDWIAREPSPENLSDPETELGSLALEDSLPCEPQGKPQN